MTTSFSSIAPLPMVSVFYILSLWVFCFYFSSSSLDPMIHHPFVSTLSFLAAHCLSITSHFTIPRLLQILALVKSYYQWLLFLINYWRKITESCECHYIFIVSCPSLSQKPINLPLPLLFSGYSKLWPHLSPFSFTVIRAPQVLLHWKYESCKVRAPLTAFLSVTVFKPHIHHLSSWCSIHRGIYQTELLMTKMDKF